MTTFAVKWIYQTVKVHGRPLEAGQKPSLCFRGRKHMVCVSAGHPVRIIKRDVVDFDKARDVTKRGKAYSVKDAIKTFRDIATRNGITRGAEQLLERAEHEQAIDESQFQDEEDVDMAKKDDVTTEPTDNAGTPAQETTVTKKTRVRKSRAKAKTIEPVRAKKTTKVAAADVPAPREGTKKAKALDLFRAGFKDLNPKDRASPPRGFGTELQTKVAKTLGWSGPAACADYYAIVRKEFAK